MIIPEIDQHLACIKAIEIQYTNGYHISEADYQQFITAIMDVQTLAELVAARRNKETTK